MILLTEQDEVGIKDRYDMIERLTNTTFDERQKSDIETQIEQCKTIGELEEISFYIYMNRIDDKDRIAMGLNYSATDIKKTIREYHDRA